MMSSSKTKKKKREILEFPPAAFKAEFEFANHWWIPLRVADSILTECHFDVSEDGLRLLQLDSSKAALLHIWLDKALFQSFECTQSGLVSFSPDTIIPTTKDVARSDTIVFSMADGKVSVCVIDDTDKRTKRCITSKPLTPPAQPDKHPSLTYGATIELPFRLFKRVMRMMNVGSSHVNFMATKDRFSMTGEGDDEAVTKSTIDREQAHSIDCEKKQETRFACDYIWAFVRPIRYNEAQSIKIDYTSSKPLRLTVSIGPASYMEFILAPRVERRF